MKQTGLLIKIDPRDYIVGASPIVQAVVNESGDWKDYKPSEERQYKDYSFDTLSCATFAALNVLETTVNFLIANNKLTKSQVDWLNENGYIENGLLNTSDRFTAIMSGTTNLGNYMQKVWDSIRKDGVLPEKDLPFGGNSFDEYHNSTLITESMKNKAKKFLDIVEASYEWSQIDTASLKTSLQQCPLEVAINSSTHAVELIDIDNVFDTYIPFLKPIPTPISFALKGIVKAKAAPFKVLSIGMYGASQLQRDLKTLGYFTYPFITGYFGSVTQRAVKAFQKANGIIQTGNYGPITDKALQEALKKKPTTTKLEAWALATQSFEGWFPGSRSYRNNNPGNIKYVGQRSATGKDDKGFCIFPDYETGLKALKDLLIYAASGKSKYYNANGSLYDFYEVYAPSSDNNHPKSYAEAVAKRIGVDPNTIINTLIG